MFKTYEKIVLLSSTLIKINVVTGQYDQDISKCVKEFNIKLMNKMFNLFKYRIFKFYEHF